MFYKRNGTKDGVRNECKECKNKINGKYIRENKDKINAYNRKRYNIDIELSRKYNREKGRKNKEQRDKYGLNYRQLINKKLLELYNNKCCCCGETEPKFLSLDHINNNGNKERKTMTNQTIKVRILKGILSKKYYQILCHNCNQGRYLNGGMCPHKS